MDDYYPYPGLEPYTGGAVSPEPSGGDLEPRASAVEKILPPPVLGRYDPRRLNELDLAGSGVPAGGGNVAASPVKVAYSHDPRRVSFHPLGPDEPPPGVSERFWSRLDPDYIEGEEPVPAIVKPDVETAVMEHPGLGEQFPRQLPTPSPAGGGGGAGRGGAPGPPDEEEEEKHDPTEMPFLDHLEELRWALLKSIIIIVIAMIASWYLSDWFYKQVTELARGGKAFLGINSVNLALRPLTGHEGKLFGRVENGKTGKPLPGAEVNISPGGYKVLTDSTGKYSIKGIPEGNYTVTASKDGYSSAVKNSGMKLVMTTVMEPLLIRLQMALVMGLILSLPLVFYFLWSFVAPGLYSTEKQWVLPLIFAATGCFFIGASIAWFVLVPYFLWFLQTFMPADVEGMFTFGKFLGLILKFTLSFGLVFELPMVTFVLAKIGIVKHTFMAKYRGYAVVIVFIISAVITPTVDPVSQTIMAIPLYLLYEISIIVARFAGRKTIM